MKIVAHIARPTAGVGTYISLLTSHINANNFQNILICNKEDQEFKFLNNLNNPIKRFDIDIAREINFVKDIKSLFQIIKLLRKVRPDLIHCHSAKAGILGRLAGSYLQIPTLYTPHAFSYLSTVNKIKKLIFKNTEKFFRVFSASILACSKSEYFRAINELNFNNSKVLLWNNSIEYPKEKNLNTNKVLLPQDYICSVGRPSYQKNIEMLIETLLYIKRTIKDIHLVLLGSGLSSTYLDKIEEMINKNNLETNITIIPWLKRDELIRIVSNSRLYVSSSRYEGLPYSVLEALSLSKPCVATNVDGNNELIKDNYNGYLVDIGDSEGMAESIISILKNKEELKRLSSNSKRLFLDNYNIKKNIVKLEEIYLSKIS